MKILTGSYVRSVVCAADFIQDDLPQVAFVGRSNVGKSSLLNRLLGRKALARISSTPGRTRAVNYFIINSQFYCVDLPGYGYAKVGKKVRREWARLIGSYFETRPERTRVVHLVDAKVGATPLDVEAADYLDSLGVATTTVATKLDKLPRSRRARQIEAIRQQLRLADSDPLIAFSAVKGDGVRELWREIGAFLQNPASSLLASSL